MIIKCLRYRVTILKNDKRQSRGVAFIQFLRIEDAESCTVLNDTEVIREASFLSCHVKKY